MEPELGIMISVIGLVVAVVALLISITALIYIAKNYFRKSGLYIRGRYSICSSSYCEDKYISSIALENMKDRSAIIFGIYLLVGRNYYIQLDNFEDEPLILKPFESYSNQYDPVDFYSVDLQRIKLDNLFDSKKAKLVLSTSEGKYVIKDGIKHWDPIMESFNNHMTAVIFPKRSTYKDKSYGSNVKYLVVITTEHGKEKIIPIYPKDYQIKKFKKFQLSEESLDSSDNLKKFLYEKVDEGVLNCIDIVVHDFEAWRDEVYDDYDEEDTVYAKYYNWFTYAIIGKIITLISDFRLRLENRKIRKTTDR